MRWALIIDDVVDTISFENQSGVEGWEEVPEGTFAGFVRDGEGGFAPPDDEPPVIPTGSRRQERACALCVSVTDGVVDAIKGSFNIAGMFRFDTGIYMGLLAQPISIDDELILVPNNGVSITLSDRGEDYFMIEVADHAGGTLIDPPKFGFTLYSF